MKLSIETCSDALNHAAMNRKAAIQLEIAVGLAVFHFHGSSSKDARAMLVDAYAAAGYRCVHINEMDYKTVNRRINATCALYEKLPVAAWIGKLDDVAAIRAVCQGLEPYELFTIADVQRFGLPAPAAPTETIKAAPHADILAGPVQSNHTGQQKVIQQFRRAADTVGVRVATDHLLVVIPEGVTKAEMIELAMRLLSLAKENDKQLLTV